MKHPVRRMKRPRGRMERRALPALFISLLGALLCLACGPAKVAGGYDDVENPAIQASLLDSLGHSHGDGEILLYARYQNPEKDSTPLIQANVPTGATGAIRDTALLSAMGRAKLRGTPWPNQDTVEFNLVAVAAQVEAFQGDFLMVKGANGAYRFLRRTGGSFVYANAKGVLETAPIMANPVLNQHGNIGARGLQLQLQSVFIPGSPYWAKVESDGSFSFEHLAQGRYEVKAVSADAKIYSGQDTLVAGTEYLPPDWSEADLIWIAGP
jgi:hypothetical protein